MNPSHPTPLRRLVWLLATLIVLTLTACAAPEATPTPTPPPPITATPEPTAEPSPTATLPPTEAPTATRVAPTATPTPDPNTLGRGATLDFFRIVDASGRGAVCNDGSPAGYYLRRSRNSAETRWIIHLAGDGMCTDKSSCEARSAESPDAMSSLGWPAARQEKGLLAADPALNPDFAAFNHVLVPYCSSDLWSGQRSAEAATGGFHFRGATIVEAVVADLSDPAVMGDGNLSEATEILLSGSGAGGVGVLNHLDRLAGLMGGTTVRGVTDGGWIVDHPAQQAVDRPVVAQVQLGYTFWQSVVDRSCARNNSLREGLCFVGAFVYPFLGTPLFVQTSLVDPVWLAANGTVPPYTTEQTANYVVDYARKTRASLGGIPAVYAPNNQNSTLLDKNRFATQAIDGVSLQAALGNWYFGRQASARLIRPNPSVSAVQTSLGDAGDMQLTMLADAAERNAVCNDGSPAGFYLRRSSDAANQTWVIYFEGGGACYDQASCAERNLGSRLTSSRTWLPTRTGTGIQSALPAENPDFADANHVYIPYCSSDLWSGNRGASAETGGWHFRGAPILQAVFTDLADRTVVGPNTLARARQILVVGGSAGGAGVMTQLDRVAEAFPDAEVKGLNDGGFLIDTPPFDPAVPAPRERFRVGYDFTNALLDATCTEANGDAPWLCLNGPTLYPFVETPIFIQIDQADSAQLGAQGISDRSSVDQLAYVDGFRAAMQAATADVAPLFSPDANVHVVSKTNLFTTLRVDGVTLQEALGDWFFGRIPAARYVDPSP